MSTPKRSACGMQMFTVDQCTACGHCAYPPRYLCPRCHGAQWKTRRVVRGILQQYTETRGRDAEGAPRTVPLATLRTDAGPLVVARLAGPAVKGASYTLTLQDQALIATPDSP